SLVRAGVVVVEVFRVRAAAHAGAHTVGDVVGLVVNGLAHILAGLGRQQDTECRTYAESRQKEHKAAANRRLRLITETLTRHFGHALSVIGDVVAHSMGT